MQAAFRRQRSAKSYWLTADCGALTARCRAADKQWDGKAAAFHFTGNEYHLVKRWRDEAAESNEIGLFIDGRLQNAVSGHHDAEIDDLIVEAVLQAQAAGVGATVAVTDREGEVIPGFALAVYGLARQLDDAWFISLIKSIDGSTPGGPTLEGEPLPLELVEKIKRASTFNEGFATVEYLASALVDMKLHLAGETEINPDQFERRTLEQLGMPRQVVMRHRTPHFAHIFAGDGYSAGYYSYLWADTLTADERNDLVAYLFSLRSEP